MTTFCLALVLSIAFMTTTAAAQTPRPTPPAPPAEPAQPAPPRPDTTIRPEPERVDRASGQWVNVRFDIGIVDEGGPQASRKAVTLTVADRQSGQVRATVFVPDLGHVPLAVDATPILEPGGKIRARITLEYQPNPGTDRKLPSSPSMRLSFGIVLENGKKIVAAQAADPVTDRQITVEITATVLK
jgi:hypothetical protein